MRSLRASRVSGWTRIGATAVAVGALLAVQVANADRPQSYRTDRQGAAELVVATSPALAARTGEPGSNAVRFERSATPRSSTTEATTAMLAGATFYAIAPYRSYDSRFDPEGPLAAGWYVIIQVITDGYGTPMIPDTAVAVTYNLTVTGTTGDAGGYLAVFPAGQPWAGNSSINWWTSGLSLANGGVVALGPEPTLGAGCVEIDISPVPGTATHFIIDITGYYAP